MHFPDDEEPTEDPFAPMKGIVVGGVLGLLIWAVLIISALKVMGRL